MLRNYITRDEKTAPADCKTSGAYATGMGVTRNLVAKTATIPASETADNLFVLQKARYATGVYAGIADLSDWLPEFNTFAAGEYCVCTPFQPTEVFGTDQYDTTGLVAGNVGKYVAVGTDGKWKIATVSSRYVFRGLVTEGTHTLARIEVMDTAGTNS